MASQAVVTKLINDDESCYSIKRIYDNNHKCTVIQVLDKLGKMYKCLFYDDNERLSNMSVYNTSTGKEIRNITYKANGRTVSSVREYNIDTEQLLSVTFYKPDGISVSSIIEYNDDGNETCSTLFCDDGEIITFSF